jgi:hypothetical protein
MLKLLRRLLGLCEHRYDCIAIEDVKWTAAQDGSIIAADMAAAGIIHHRSYTMVCRHCTNVKVKRVKP